MCGHGSSSATTSSTQSPSQGVQEMYKYLMEQGKALQQKPYESYTGEMVPELNAIQQSGINQAQQYSTAAQPYYQRAGQMTQDVYSGYNPQNYASGVQSYMNPYMQNAMGATAAQMNNLNQQEQNKLLGNAISSGAFGGDRGKIAQSALMGQQNLALGNVMANMANTGYNSAATNYLSGLQQQGGLANQYGNFGTNVQNAGMTGAQGLMTAGAVPYAVQQAQDAAKYQQFSQGQAYPFQTLGLLANMASGLGAGQGGTSSTTSPGPNSMNSILGLGTAFLNMPDERTKENAEPIGKTFDGQNIYKFNYKGDPKTNIGLMAQEVEKHAPSAVHKTDGGLRMVDYDAATSHAADRGHFAGGGSSMGGLVSAGMERQPYAKGGYGLVPYADDPLYAFMSERVGIPMVAYVPQIDIKGGGVGIPESPKAYEDKPYDTSGITGFGKAFGKNSSVKAFLGNNFASATQPGTWQAPTSDYWSYADGGLVPRSHHASGDTPPKGNDVPADDNFLGGLGSSIAKGVGGLFSTDTQPGLIGNIFNAGKPLDEDTRLGIMAAGLGMAASPSPFVGQAIGQGGLTGLNTYANRKKAIAEQALKSREIGVQEAKIPSEIAEMQARTAVARAGLYSKQWIPGYGFVLYDNTNPTLPPKRITDENMKPLTEIKPETVPNAPGSADPLPLAKTGGQKIPVTSSTPAVPETKIIDPTKVPEGFMPEEQFNIQMNPTLAKDEAANAAKALATQRDKSIAAYGQLYRLDEMDRQYGNLPPTGPLSPGSYATERGEFAKGVNTFLQGLGGAPVFDTSSVASIENLTKDRFRLGAELSRSIGGHEPGFIVQQSVQANPGTENTALGYKRITEGLRQAAEYEKNRTAFYEDYAAKFGHLNGAEKLFVQQNPPEMYSKRAILSTVDPEDAKALREYAVKNTDPSKAMKAFDDHYGKGVSNLVLGQ